MKKSFVLAFLLISSIVSFTQEQKKLSVYFPSGQAIPDSITNRVLDSFFRALPVKVRLHIRLAGNTDSTASDSLNKKLSADRAINVKGIIEKWVPSSTTWELDYWGEEKPLANNASPEGRQQNRRVDIFVTQIPFTDFEVLHISDLYKELKPSSQRFCISNRTDTLITTKAGSLVFIKANSFSPKGNCPCIEIVIDEAFTKADIVSHNLSTSSNGLPLVSQGMISIEAYCNKTEYLNLLPDKDIVVMTPADTIVPEAAIFNGEWDSHDDIQWTTDTTSLANFTPADARNCLRGLGFRCGFKPDKGCDTCAFFFCGLSRKIKALGNRKQRTLNADQASCKRWEREKRRLEQQRQRDAGKAYKALDSLNKVKIDSMAKLWNVKKQDLALAVNRCGAFIQMLEKNNIRDLQAFTDGLERQIDSLGVGEPYRKKILLSDLQYYVFNKNRMGWSNVDWLFKISPDKMVDFSVLPPAKQGFTDCKLVFKNQQTVLEGIDENGKYVFKALPKGESAFLVFFEMKDGKETYFGMKEIKIDKGEFIIDTKATSIKEMRDQLESIDKKK